MKHRTRLFSEVFVLIAVCLIAVFLIQKKESAQDPMLMPGVASSKDRASFTAARKLSSNAPKLMRYAPELAFDGVTLYPISGTAEVLLLNMQGVALHRWKVDADRARLLPNCNLLVVHGSKWGLDKQPWEALRPIVREYDWNGKPVWQYQAPDIAHHDVRRLENGNTLILHRTVLPASKLLSEQELSSKDLEIRSDSLLEVSPSDQIVWQWHAHERLDVRSCGRRDCKATLGKQVKKKMKDWTHINTASVIPENRWFDAGDARFTPGNIMITPRNWWMAMIIDRLSGEVVWKYSGDYKGGLVRGHEIHMIGQGLPGAGNVLIFDNGAVGTRKSSFILEVNPVTNELIWVYDAGKKFFSHAAGSVQRLPNGNTLISEDVPGRVFEVTADKKIVWELQGKHRTSRVHRYTRNFCSKLSSF